MAETTTETRLGKLETEFAIVKNDVTAIGRSLAEFREDWATKADEDRNAHRAARLTFPQIVAVLAGTATMTALLLGGLMYLINVSTASVRSDLTSQVASAKQSAEAANAQTGLTVRGMIDDITALNTGMQTMRREQALDRVKLGFVEQSARANTAFIDKAQSFDVFMAGHDERLKAREQTVRDIAARRPHRNRRAPGAFARHYSSAKHTRPVSSGWRGFCLRSSSLHPNGWCANSNFAA